MTDWRLTVGELIDNECWRRGPEFLIQPETKWPKGAFTEATKETREEMKAEVRERTDLTEKDNPKSFLTNKQTNQTEHKWGLDPSRFSKWYKIKTKNKFQVGRSLVRVRSWVHRFIANCRKPIEQRYIGELTPDELKVTEKQIVRDAQCDAFTEEIKALADRKVLPRKSSILTFTPMLTDGILRSNTRLRCSDILPDETKYPIILPKGHLVTKLIVKYHHQIEGHEMGLNYTLNHLREKYVVVHGREAVKKIFKECPECQRRFRGKPATQQMAPLPSI